MATFGRSIRRGLPRVAGGEPWPPAGVVAAMESAVPEATPAEDAPVVPAAPDAPTSSAVADAAAAPDAPATSTAPAAPAAPVASATPPAPAVPVEATRPMRRGLPRVPGGEPWPPASADAGTGAMEQEQEPQAAASEQRAAASATPAEPAAPAGTASAAAVPEEERSSAEVASPSRVSHADAPAGAGRMLRRGLPRVPGGEPWPPAGHAPALATAEPAATAPATTTPAATVPGAPAPEHTDRRDTATSPAAAEASTPAATTGPLAPLPFHRSVTGGAAAARWRADRARALASRTPITRPEPVRHGPFTAGQWAGAVIVAGAGLIVAAAMLVLLMRWFLSLGFMQDFLTAYPGAYDLPASAPVGFAAWVNWQHFFNIFLMVLIVRSGLTVHYQKRPTVFWSPKGNPARKVSIAVWLHQSLDILWIVNGAVFIVLLFTSGQWMRLVPTSWDVFPNALSAGLQYVSLDWPIEDGWVNYNSLQQLAYFTVVFIAAPLAIATGVRMSGIWPSKAKKLSAAYPVEWARAVHFPVMVFFVLFIIGHVFLVLTTGALRNLNTMFAARSADGWVGFWLFIAAMIVVAIGWVAARPLVLAPIARLFGRVSGR